MRDPFADSTTIDGLGVARIYKHYLYAVRGDSYATTPQVVPYRNFYKNNQQTCDRMAELLTKYRINAESLVKFYLFNLGKTGITGIMTSTTVGKYVEWRQSERQYRKIYGYYVKSVNNIVSDCICKGYANAKDYIRMLIRTKTLASNIMSGRISIYFFAAIPKFKDIIPKLDQIARMELSDLYARFDKYSADINDAHLKAKNIMPNPIRLVDKKIGEELERRV